MKTITHHNSQSRPAIAFVRLPLLAILLVAAAVSAWPRAAAAAEGYWKLLRVEPHKPRKLVFRDYGTTGSARNGSFVTEVRFWDKYTKKFTDKYVITWTWSRMPNVLRPGDKLRLTMKGTVTYQPKVWVGIRHGWMGARTASRTTGQWYPGGDFRDSKGKGMLAFHVADKQGTTRQLHTAVVVPAGSRGRQFATDIILEHPDQTRWTWRHVYEWKDGTRPAKTNTTDPPVRDKTGKTEPEAIRNPVRAGDVVFADNFNAENRRQGQLNYTGFRNWDVPRGAVDLAGKGFWDHQPGNGMYLDLDGTLNTRATAVAGTLATKRSFDLVAGQTYVLQFDLAGNPFQGPNTVTVKLGGAFSEEFSLPKQAPKTGFKTFQRTIRVARSCRAKLVFAHHGGDWDGLLLDNVTLWRRR